MNSEFANQFRRRLGERQTPLYGTFIKTPTSHAVEIIGGLGFDFVVIDQEHAPFDRGSTEVALLAASASAVAGIVRVAAATPDRLLAALDDGAAGVMAPHICSAAAAAELVAACRYAHRRGYSNSPRAGDYGAKGMWDHVDSADDAVTVIAMIEDPKAVEEIDAILAVDGLDGIFIGRGDLCVALNDRQPGAPQVRAATEKVIAAARRARKAVCVMPAGPAEAAELSPLGVSAFVVSSDQGFMRSAATAALNAFRSAMPAQVCLHAFKT